MAARLPIEPLATSKDDYKYGWSQPENYVFKSRKGLDHEIVEQISAMKGEPDWMRQFRHEALDIFLSKPIPTWGADLSGIDYRRHLLLHQAGRVAGQDAGTMCRATSKRPSTSWASLRPSASSWPVWARSMRARRSTTR